MSENKTKVTAKCSYIQGHIRYGHFDMFLTDEQLKEFKALDCDKQKNYIRELGELIVDDYEIDDYDDPSNIKLHE